MMLSKLPSIECPVCEVKMDHGKYKKIPNPSKLEFLQIEIQCPICKSELIMTRGSQKRLKWLLLAILVSLPVFIAMIADHFNVIHIAAGMVGTLLTTFAVMFLAVFIFVVFTIRYELKAGSNS